MASVLIEGHVVVIDSDEAARSGLLTRTSSMAFQDVVPLPVSRWAFEDWRHQRVPLADEDKLAVFKVRPCPVQWLHR